MKRLFNVSPFILLLIPVFVAGSVSAISLSNKNRQNEEAALKSTTSVSSANLINCFSK